MKFEFYYLNFIWFFERMILLEFCALLNYGSFDSCLGYFCTYVMLLSCSSLVILLWLLSFICVTRLLRSLFYLIYLSISTGNIVEFERNDLFCWCLCLMFSGRSSFVNESSISSLLSWLSPRSLESKILISMSFWTNLLSFASFRSSSSEPASIVCYLSW